MSSSETTPASSFPQSFTDGPIHVSLTYSPLDPTTYISQVRSPEAGATVLFLGTTRSSFEKRPVTTLSYSAYAPLALKTLQSIATSVHKKHGITAISMVHRLGEVKVGEESIVIAVSSPHRQAAWKAGEEALEVCKSKTEVWKMEVFGDEEGGAVWRANRDGIMGEKIEGKKGLDDEDVGKANGGLGNQDMALDDIHDQELKAQVIRMQILFPSVSVYDAQAVLASKQDNFDAAVDYLAASEAFEQPRRGSLTAF
jgi:molybdopterin synthase catalytic subunit